MLTFGIDRRIFNIIVAQGGFMYFLFAIPAAALIVVLTVWLYDLTGAFREPRVVEVPSDVLADALIEHMIESDRSH
jgi:hypothetical protein